MSVVDPTGVAAAIKRQRGLVDKIQAEKEKPERLYASQVPNDEIEADEAYTREFDIGTAVGAVVAPIVRSLQEGMAQLAQHNMQGLMQIAEMTRLDKAEWAAERRHLMGLIDEKNQRIRALEQAADFKFNGDHPQPPRKRLNEGDEIGGMLDELAIGLTQSLDVPFEMIANPGFMSSLRHDCNLRGLRVLESTAGDYVRIVR